MEQNIKVSIIITAYKNRNILRQLLKGIFNNPPEHSFEVIVVDNNSQDGTKEMITDFPKTTFICRNSNDGLAVGNNEGVRHSQGEYIFILNPDIAVFKGEIDKLIRFADTHQEAGIVGPQLLHPDRTLQYSTYRFPKWFTPLLRRTPLGALPFAKKYLREYLMMDWDHKKSATVDWVLGAAMLVRRSTLEKVGLQDERFFLYFEDVDWCKRFWNAGSQVWYTPEAFFIHYHKRESAESPGLKGIISPVTKIHIQSWILYLKKYGLT